MTFPSRVPLSYAFLFAGLLTTGEFLEGTPGSLCAIVFSYVIVTVLAFNAAGGLQYATGAYVLFNAVLTSMLGLALKFFLGEPVQSNLQDGRSTMLVYLAGECALLAAVYGSRKFLRKKPVLEGLLTQGNVQQIALGSIILGIGLPNAVSLLGLTSLQSTVAQLNNFVTLAITLSVYQRVKATGGRSSFTWPALIASTNIVLQGIASASKQALFTPIAAWLLAAIAAGYRVSARQLLAIGAGCYLAVYVFVPYSQYARLFRENGVGAVPIEKSIEILSHPIETRKLVLQQGEEQLGSIYHWFDHSQGFFDRLNMVSIDDPLIYATNQGQVAGLRNIWLLFPNIIPTFLYKDKPFLYFGNAYGKEIHVISDDDNVTGISFSPFADAYHTGKWLGLLIVMPVILCALFAISDSVAGDIRASPWPLFYMLVYAHIASEGALGSPVYMMSEGSFALVVVAFTSVYITPLFGGLVIGPGVRPAGRDRAAQPTSSPRRVASATAGSL